MNVRSGVATAAIVVLCVVVATDVLARGRSRCKKMAVSSGSGCSSWGGSYSSCGSSGGSYQPTCHVVVQNACTSSASYGSCGGSGGTYVNCGSVGGVYNAQVVHVSAQGQSLSYAGNVVLHRSYVRNSSQPTRMVYAQSPSSQSRLLIPHQPLVVGQFKSPQASPIAIASTQSAATATSTATATVSVAANDQSSVTVEATAQDRSVLEVAEESAGPCAYLVLRDLPANAEVYLVDMKMTARGSLRKYRIPVRAKDLDYSYPVEIRIPDSSEPPAQATVQVRAGETTELLVTRLNDRLIVSESEGGKIDMSVPLARN